MPRFILGRLAFSATILIAAASFGRQTMAQHIESAKDCQGLANIPTATCFGDATRKAEAEMDSVLVAIRDVLVQADDRERLEATQQAWVKYRDLTCDAESRVYFGDGSGRATADAACLEAETRFRITDLHEGYDWRVEWMRRQQR